MLPAAPFRLSSADLTLADKRALNECVPSSYGWKPCTFLRVLKGGGGGTSPISQPIFFRNPTSQCSNPIPTSRIWKKSQCYTYHLFSLRIRKITASKYDPTKTQKFTRIYKDVLKITGSFQTVIKLSSSEFIAISPCHFTFLPFLPAENLPSDL